MLRCKVAQHFGERAALILEALEQLRMHAPGEGSHGLGQGLDWAGVTPMLKSCSSNSLARAVLVR